MTSTWEMTRKGKYCRISFTDQRVIVVIDDVQVTIANPHRRGKGGRKYHACEAHCVRLFERAMRTRKHEGARVRVMSNEADD